MIHMVTGKINSGKTTRMLNMYRNIGRGDGYVSIKHMKDDQVHSYELMRLTTKEKRLLVLREDYLSDDWVEGCKIGPYSFSKNALDDVHNTMLSLLEQKISPLFLDEVGQLELQGKAFYRTFKQLVKKADELYVTVREDNIQDIVRTFELHIKGYDIIT